MNNRISGKHDPELTINTIRGYTQYIFL